MKIFDVPFSKAKKQKEYEEIFSISRIVGPLIEKTVFDIFESYREYLIKEPITYIVPAIWLDNRNNELDALQIEIHNKAASIIDEVFRSLKLKDLSNAQEFAIFFLIRGLFISKITYMIEAYKNQQLMGAIQGRHLVSLEEIKPFGNA